MSVPFCSIGTDEACSMSSMKVSFFTLLLLSFSCFTAITSVCGFLSPSFSSHGLVVEKTRGTTIVLDGHGKQTLCNKLQEEGGNSHSSGRTLEVSKESMEWSRRKQLVSTISAGGLLGLSLFNLR